MDRVGYAERRPYAVLESLSDLRGPAHGVVRLPASLAWTGRADYDLDDAADRIVFYERVLVEALDTGTVARGKPAATSTSTPPATPAHTTASHRISSSPASSQPNGASSSKQD